MGVGGAKAHTGAQWPFSRKICLVSKHRDPNPTPRGGGGDVPAMAKHLIAQGTRQGWLAKEAWPRSSWRCSTCSTTGGPATPLLKTILVFQNERCDGTLQNILPQNKSPDDEEDAGMVIVLKYIPAKTLKTAKKHWPTNAKVPSLDTPGRRPPPAQFATLAQRIW